MKTYNYWQSKISLIFVIILLVLLPTLAVLQYNWLGQINEAERERMQASLRTAATNFTGDFDREITYIFFSLQNPKINLENQNPQEDTLKQGYIEAYKKWLTNSKHPKLVKDIYIIDGILPEEKFLKLSLEKSAFVPSEIPLELKNLKQSWQETSTFSGDSELTKIKIQKDVPVLADIPAIIVSVPKPPTFPQTDNSKIQNRVYFNLDIPVTNLVVLLDKVYIEQEWFPSLTKQYFSRNNQMDYHVRVVNTTKPEQVIYQSNEQISNVNNSDIKLGFFSLNSEELEKFLFINAKEEKETFDRLIGHRENREENREEKTEIKDGKTIKKQTHKATFSIVQSIRVTGKSSSEMPKVKMLSFTKTKEKNSHPWELVVKHRSGSLEIAVTSLRQRNLIISSSILLLLAVSMGMILVSTRRAQRLAKQQIEFVAGVSHELRTPLAVICSAGENLADGVVNKPEQIKRYGSLIKGEGRRLNDMVEQILEFAGWQSHRKTYQLQPTNVASLVENAISACSGLINETNTEIVLDLEPTLPLVEADPSALQRAVQNLIANGIKYSGEIKWLKIEAKSQVRASQVEINVIDKGIGIPAKEIPYIFEPFYRGQEVIDAQIHGSGLGLSLVNQIVSSCGGKVTVTSLVNQGSTFTLHLPLAKAKQIEIAKEIYE